MYINSAPQAKTDKPCDGARHNYFHSNDGLMRHQIEIGARLQPEIVQKPFYDSQKEGGHDFQKKGGARPCGGKLYHVYHTEQKSQHSHNATNHVARENTLETKLDSYMHPPNQHNVQQTGEIQASYVQTNYLSQADMRSVEEALYHMLKSGEYVRHMKQTEHAAQAIYHRIRSDVSEKRYNISDDVAAKVEEKYSRKYEQNEARLYKGSEIKMKKEAKKTEKDSETVKEIKKESKIEDKRPQTAAKRADRAKKTAKAKTMKKKAAKNKAAAGKNKGKNSKKAVSRNLK